ncbi:MAG: GNAT family N-acetyltransferase [Azospirillum brasilense]|nr:MAG: GNAT family N-acetyltransferase [Azospirillum brasilense]
MSGEIPILRSAVPAEAGAIRALSRAAYARWVPLIGREPWPMTADYAEALRKGHRIDLLHKGEILAGLVEMILGPDHLMIENVAVLPAHQGQGLGRFLVGHAEAVARAEGHGLVRLYTNQRFAENIRLYHRLGYEVEREEIWTGGVIVHMRKTLGA